MSGLVAQRSRASLPSPPVPPRRRASNAAVVIPSVFLPIDPERLARRLLLLCTLVTLLFVLLDYQINLGRLVEIGAVRRLFDIAGKDGLAAWFQTTQTLLTALTVWFLYIVTRQQRASRWRRTGFLLLALFFGAMALGEGTELPERLGTTFEALGGSEVVASFPGHRGQLLHLPALAAAGLFTLAFLWWELLRFSKRIWLLLALGLFTLAIGMDLLGGLGDDHPLNVAASLARWPRLESWSQVRFGEPASTALSHFSVAAGEALEMVAVSIFWFLFLGQVGWVTRELQLRFWRS